MAYERAGQLGVLLGQEVRDETGRGRVGRGSLAGTNTDGKFSVSSATSEEKFVRTVKKPHWVQTWNCQRRQVWERSVCW